MKNKQQEKEDSAHTIAEQDEPAGVGYFMQKFHISAKDVEDAIKKVGNSSETLEQYFIEQRLNAPF